MIITHGIIEPTINHKPNDKINPTRCSAIAAKTVQAKGTTSKIMPKRRRNKVK